MSSFIFDSSIHIVKGILFSLMATSWLAADEKAGSTITTQRLSRRFVLQRS